MARHVFTHTWPNGVERVVCIDRADQERQARALCDVLVFARIAEVAATFTTWYATKPTCEVCNSAEGVKDVRLMKGARVLYPKQIARFTLCGNCMALARGLHTSVHHGKPWCIFEANVHPTMRV